MGLHWFERVLRGVWLEGEDRLLLDLLLDCVLLVFIRLYSSKGDDLG